PSAPRPGRAVAVTEAVPCAGTVTDPPDRVNMPAGAGVPRSASGSTSYGPPATATVSARFRVTGAAPVLVYATARSTGAASSCGQPSKPKYADPVAVTVAGRKPPTSTRPAP